MRATPILQRLVCTQLGGSAGLVQLMCTSAIGQGLNASMGDTQPWCVGFQCIIVSTFRFADLAIAWKIAYVLRGWSPLSLLKTVCVARTTYPVSPRLSNECRSVRVRATHVRSRAHRLRQVVLEALQRQASYRCAPKRCNSRTVPWVQAFSPQLLPVIVFLMRIYLPTVRSRRPAALRRAWRSVTDPP